MSNRNSKTKTGLRSSFYQLIAATLTVGGMSLLPLYASAQTSSLPPINNTATATFESPNSLGTVISTISNTTTLLDLAGISSCDGSLLTDYTGFSIGLYESLNSTGEIGQPVSLTATVPPNQASASIQAGRAPNFYNSNPFFLVNSDQGKYNFLFDVNRGQIDVGRVYILVVKPPTGSAFGERRIRITLNSRNGNIVNYTATSLDGNPISASSASTSLNGVIDVSNATSGLNLVAGVNFGICVSAAQAIQLLKTGDRAAAEPGDIVVYRLAARNLSTTAVNNPEIRDDLPLGFQYVDGSIRAELGGNAVAVTVERNGRNLVFRPNVSLPRADSNLTLNLVYAVQITNDAIRGTGLNRASIAGARADNQQIVRDGPVSHLLRIRPGILSDCGTLIGRVFVDKNFDGEQQPGEPGVPNAVIYMDDGNRIVTDPNGLYSLSSVLSGSRTLALDLTSVPGYTLAPNLYFIERNSQSRLVRLAPGGLGRVNFAVTPANRGLRDANQGGKK